MEDECEYAEMEVVEVVTRSGAGGQDAGSV